MKYKTYDLTTEIDGEEIKFSVDAYVSVSDESNVGLSSCEIEINYNYESLQCDEQYRELLKDKIQNLEFDEEVYSKWCEDNDELMFDDNNEWEYEDD